MKMKSDYKISIEQLNILLQDHTTRKNILWLTDDYKQYGDEYGEFCEIKSNQIIRNGKSIIIPRNRKPVSEQITRSRVKAEVFTPSWFCNLQNNAIDDAWFGRKDIFNICNGQKWDSTNHVDFCKKSWQEYVASCRLEITCGEAPYLVSRYEATSGEAIPIKQRIGILDRKLRVVGENCSDETWYSWAKKAFQSTYGYEWSGDNLFLARQNLLFTFFDYCYEQFKESPNNEMINEIAEIISWNIWQMDGLKYVVPCSCHEEIISSSLFDEESESKLCEGCTTGNVFRHNGLYCIIKDWEANKDIRAVDMIGGR